MQNTISGATNFYFVILYSPQVLPNHLHQPAEVFSSWKVFLLEDMNEMRYEISLMTWQSHVPVLSFLIHRDQATRHERVEAIGLTHTYNIICK